MAPSYPDYQLGQIVAFVTLDSDRGSLFMRRWCFGRVQRSSATMVYVQGSTKGLHKKRVRPLTDEEQQIVAWLHKRPRTTMVHVDAPNFDYSSNTHLMPTVLQQQTSLPLDRMDTLRADLQLLAIWWDERPRLGAK